MGNKLTALLILILLSVIVLTFTFTVNEKMAIKLKIGKVESTTINRDCIGEFREFMKIKSSTQNSNIG